MWVLDLFMIFSPLIGFIDQYKKIKETRNSEIFSTNVSFILIVCNTLRIFFWIGKRFENVMLYQSIAMIIGQYFMLHICHQFSTNKKSSSSLFDFSAFWKWNSFLTYIHFLFFLFGILIIFTLMKPSLFYYEVLGTLSLFLESLLAVPQVIKNYQNKSTKGLR